MANIIIGIHGLGNKPPSGLLEDWWKLSMTEGLQRNMNELCLPSFKLVYWADIIHPDPLDPDIKDPEDPLFLDEAYTVAPGIFPAEDYHVRKKFVDYLGRQMNRIFLNEDLSLNYSFISDVIINHYFRDLEIYYSGFKAKKNGGLGLISEEIRERLVLMLRKHRKDNIMLISHSMGSIIAFDVLTFIVPEIKINTLITIGSPLGLPAVISKIASEMKLRGFNEKQVRTPPGISRGWYNFSDILDKVAFNYRLSELFPENEYGIKPVDFLVTNDYEYEGERNPHKSFGYLRAPEFSRVLEEFIRTERINLVEKIAHILKESFRHIKSRLFKKEKI